MARKKTTNKTTRALSRRKTTKTAAKKKARTNKQAPRSTTKRPTAKPAAEKKSAKRATKKRPTAKPAAKKKSAKRPIVKKASAARTRKKSSAPSGSGSRSKKKTAARKKAPGAKVKTATRKKPKTKATPKRTASRRRSNVSTQDRSPEPPPITDYTDRSEVSTPSEVIEESASIAPAPVTASVALAESPVEPTAGSVRPDTVETSVDESSNDEVSEHEPHVGEISEPTDASIQQATTEETASVALAESPVEPTAESARPAETEAFPQPLDSLGQAQETKVESQDPAVEPIENASPDESYERPASPQAVETEVESSGGIAPADHPSPEPLSLDEVASHLDELLNASTLAEPQKPGQTVEPQASSSATPGAVETSSTDESSNDEVSEHEPHVGEISEPTDASIQQADTEETASDADARGVADSIGPGDQPRDVDQASAEQPPPSAEPMAEEPAEESSAVEGLDDALASEVQSLMEEDFESVEQRLDNDSQERDEAAGSENPTPPGPSEPSAEAGTAVSTPDEQRPAEPGSEEGVADPSSSTGEDVETDELNSSAAAPAEGASPSPQAEESTPPKDEAATEADPQSPPESDSQPDAKSEAKPAGSESSATTAAQPADGEKEESRRRPVGVAVNLATHAVWSAAEPHVVSVLRWMNSPLRHVPPSARPAVDWIALSLVFWVPIVWLIALFAVGR